MLSLREWLIRHDDVYIDPRIEIEPTRVTALESIPRRETVARIPKSLILSHKTSTLSTVLAEELDPRVAPAIRLAVHVLYELELGPESPWSGYFEHCPRDVVEIGLLACPRDGAAWSWLRGTEIDREMSRIKLDRELLGHIFEAVVLPVFASLSTSRTRVCPPLTRFEHAYSLVSSRAFQIDHNYHELALVPLADAFNHLGPGENDVEFVSGLEDGQGWVCAVCGNPDECRHDLQEETEFDECFVRQGHDEDDDDTCDLVTTDAPIAPGQELFNSYGPLSNARLYLEYGFKLEANEHDRATFDPAEIVDALTELGLATTEFVRATAEVARGGTEGDVDEQNPLIAEQSPVHEARTTPFDLYVDADAKISFSLWSLIALSVSARRDLSFRDLLAHSATRLYLGEEDEVSVCESEQEEEEEDGVVDRDVLAILDKIARVVRTLCCRRIDTHYESGLSGSDLLERAEGVEDRFLRLTIELVAEERLLLERVVAKWQAISGACASAAHS